MANKPITSSLLLPQPTGNPMANKLFVWFCGLICFGLFVAIFVQISVQVVGSPVAHRLEILQDIALPSVLPLKFLPDVKTAPQHVAPLDPGISVRFDHFDFQAIDPKTRLLFIAHTGPAPDAYNQFEPSFNPDTDSKIDGHVLVFDLATQKVVGRVDVPQITGVVVAPDIGRVYAADGNDNIVYSIDEKTLKATPILLGDNEGPDAMSYDQVDHKIIVSDPGVPPTPPNGPFNAQTLNVHPDNQNVSIIDVRTNEVKKINLGHMHLLPAEHPDLIPWGFDVGHNRYDEALHRAFVVTGQLTDQSPVTPALPPPGTSELLSFDPASAKILDRLQLPTTCGSPHGMTIDQEQQIAFIACTDVDPEAHLVQNLIRVDLRAMKVIPDPLLPLANSPDIIVIDTTLHLVFVGCVAGISIFDVHGRTIKKLGDYLIARGTHTIAIDEVTHYLYLPLSDVGGRPTLRVVRYNPNGV